MNVTREEFSELTKDPQQYQLQETCLNVMFYGFGGRTGVMIHSDSTGSIVSVEGPHASE